ncbi:MAG TPA: hypothetical protein VGD43_04845, partial [Micromonospora sp.]
MTDRDDHVWRDEERIPLRELERAMASPAGDGEVDDVTGNDAGSESSFGHGPEAVDRHPTGPGGAVEGRDMTDDQRAYRPSSTGRT